MDNQAVFSFSDRCIVFEWDDDGRMTAIVDGTHRSEFAYDGYGRRIKIAEFDNGVITSKKLYWWLGGEIVTEREGLTAGFPVTKQFFSQGVIANGIKLFYTFDQLGSVRELIDSTGAIRADYRFDTYGKRTKESGDLDSDWGYAGLWHHGPSGLDLATHRTYDSAQGRWISRDPLGEGVDYNLYRYCGNNPMAVSDPSGLQPPLPLLANPLEVGDPFNPESIGGLRGLQESGRALENGIQERGGVTDLLNQSDAQTTGSVENAAGRLDGLQQAGKMGAQGTKPEISQFGRNGRTGNKLKTELKNLAKPKVCPIKHQPSGYRLREHDLYPRILPPGFINDILDYIYRYPGPKVVDG
jgi:RHS repeat-associated protein